MASTLSSASVADRIVLGCNAIGLADRADDDRLIAGALAQGIRTFDTADIYTDGESERRLGRAVGGRSDVFIISKFGHPATVRDHPPGSPQAIRRSLEASLRRLARDQIDIYLIHFPDPVTPIERTLETLARLRDEGLIGGWGASNVSVSQTQALLAAAPDCGLPAPTLIQGELHLLAGPEEIALANSVMAGRVPFGAFFPLASGLLGGRGEAGRMAPSAQRQRVVRNIAGRFYTPRNLAIVERLSALCEEHAVTLPHLALTWLMARDDVAQVILGASSAQQFAENLAALNRPLEPALLTAARHLVVDSNDEST